MINNVDEHTIPPIWRHEKLIRIKTGCSASPLYYQTRTQSGQVLDIEKVILFHIAAVGWISPQTGYEIQGSITKPYS